MPHRQIKKYETDIVLVSAVELPSFNTALVMYELGVFYTEHDAFDEIFIDRYATEDALIEKFDEVVDYLRQREISGPPTRLELSR